MPEPVEYLLVVTAGSTASFKVTSPRGDSYRSQGRRLGTGRHQRGISRLFGTRRGVQRAQEMFRSDLQRKKNLGSWHCCFRACLVCWGVTSGPRVLPKKSH